MADDITSDLIRQHEGYRSQAYWDVNHYRVGYGSDTWTDANGKVHPVTASTVITKDDAERDLQRRIASTQAAIVGKVGADAWNQLPDNTKAAVTSVAYNYGGLDGLRTLTKAVQSGDPAAISAAIAARANDNGGVNSSRRLAEAQIANDVSPADSFAAIRGSVPTSQLGGIDERMLGMLGTGGQPPAIPASFQPLPAPPPLVAPAQNPSVTAEGLAIRKVNTVPIGPDGNPVPIAAPIPRPTPVAPAVQAINTVAPPTSGYDGTKRMAYYQPFPSQATINPDAAVQAAKDAGMITGMAGMMPNGMIWSGALGQKGMGDTIAQQLAASGAGTFDTKTNKLSLSQDTMNQINAAYAKMPSQVRDMFGTNPAHYIANNPNISKVASVTMPPAQTFPMPVPRPTPPVQPQRLPDTYVASPQPTQAQLQAIRAVPSTPPSTPFNTAVSPPSPAIPPLPSQFSTPALAPGLTAAQKYAMSALPQTPYMPPMMLPNDAMAYGIGIPTLPQAPSALAPLVHRNIAPAPVWRPVPPPVQMVQIGSGRVVPVGTQGQRNGQGYAVQKDGSILHSGGWSTPAPGQPEKWWQANNPENW